MRILVACPIKDKAWAVPFWYDGICAQEMDVDVLCLLTPSEDATEEELRARDVKIVYDTEHGRRLDEIEGHHWGKIATYEYMARLRNQILDMAPGYDYLLSLDSDIVLPEGALEKLIRTVELCSFQGIVVSPAVNMLVHGTAWNTMSWVDKDTSSFAHRPTRNPTGGWVDVVMAAMLLDARAIAECAWASHPQGEDVGFCMDARLKGIGRYWHDDIRCLHMMRKPLA